MNRVVIVISAIDVGGAQRFCLNMAKYFNFIKYDYEILFLRKGKSKELRDEFIRNQIVFKELNCKSVTRALPQLIQYLNKIHPDIILSTVGNVDFITALAKIFTPKTKLIIRKANVVFDNQRNFVNKLKLKFESQVCYRMVALTNDMKEDYLQYGFRKEQITVINNMIDLDYINRRCAEDHLKHKWFENKMCKIIVANARMVPEKRYDVLIKAFEIVEGKMPEARLLILGDGVLKKQIEDMIPENIKSKVDFLGFQNNPYFYMTNADVFALTSDYEGFPNVVIEAFACGLPVVATDCKTGPREIIQEGIEGYVVERGDYHAVANKLLKILSDQDFRLKCSNNAKTKARQYGVEIIAQEYVELFSDNNKALQ